MHDLPDLTFGASGDLSISQELATPPLAPISPSESFRKTKSMHMDSRAVKAILDPPALDKEI